MIRRLLSRVSERNEGMGERILRDRLETLKMKDLDKFDRAAIDLLCIHGV